ncbi:MULTISPECIES: AI-2E family transporter [Ramlibacter]|uniref:AI-2E family transporter n=1 Tax=Ramlibacter aquaticus TaxID=2780094 RepID=A0ABR9SBS2_9BURK|nr:MULTISPECIES: AI-2E family transporter [Ramlibacter]MBE7939793.1 AI-2E family transporter [Ramlibacter aquaticus]
MNHEHIAQPHSDTPTAAPTPTPADPAPPAPSPLPADPDDPTHVLLHMPLRVRSATLAVLMVIMVVATLRWASAFFIPLMLGFMLSYALGPIVDALQRWRVPRALSAAVLILGLLGGAGTAAWSFSDDLNAFVDTLPNVASRLREALHKRGGQGATMDKVQKAATQLEQAAAEAGPNPGAARNVQRVVVEKPRFDIRDHLWSGTLGLASFAGQATVVTFLAYFLLLSGDTFRRKLVKVTGHTLSEKKITVQALDEITEQIQRYLLVQLVAGVIVGVATGLAFWALGLKHPGVWGVAGGVLNLIPYIGSGVVTAAAALAAFVQFGEVDHALYVAGASLLVHALVGNLLVPWLTSRASRMNPVAVFIGVLAWGWLWGVWGLLLGIPILMIVKAVCDRVDHLKPVGELLGD